MSSEVERVVAAAAQAMPEGSSSDLQAVIRAMPAPDKTLVCEALVRDLADSQMATRPGMVRRRGAAWFRARARLHVEASFGPWEAT
jgi:hypothetical protein